MMTVRMILAVGLLAGLGDAAETVVRVVVAQDGSGEFQTIQRAIDHAPVYGDKRLVIEIRPGVYHERVIVPKDKPRVTFLGQDAAKTVITADVGAAAVGGTFFSETVEVEADGFQAENITFENSHGTGTQAVALMIHSDGARFEKCRFVGWQDTLYAASGRQVYHDCFIEGHVDFIFGNATAVFEHCEIRSRGTGYVTAHSRLTANGTTGFFFLNCDLTADEGVKGVYLGRPWRPYAHVLYIDCRMGAHILPAGWDNWQSAENEKTAFFAEVGSSGPGGGMGQRVAWARHLSADEERAVRAEVKRLLEK